MFNLSLGPRRAAVGDPRTQGCNVIPRSKIAGMKPPYMCPGCFIHKYSNNMIIDPMFSNISTYSLQNDPWVQRKLHQCSGKLSVR
jgi:hypothetical protein